jgi:hypothetical protein
MPARGHTTLDPGEVVVEDLSRRLREAVRRTASTNGNGSARNGSGRGRARRIAVDMGAAMLADAGAGTAEHSNDVVLITDAIAERMGIEGDEADDLLAAAQLHDIGKAWVPSGLLEKAGPLTDEEWEVMRRHTVVGERILSSVEELKRVSRLVRYSHERWDGGGYPDGLAGSDIPLGSRIIFCADAFHAIRCDRPYRAGRSAGEAVSEITRCAGTQFDPRVAGALERVVQERSERRRVGGGSTRLLALLMCLVLGGAGTAIARSGLFQELPPAPLAKVSSSTPPPPGCGTAACPGVDGPVGGLGPVGALSGTPGPRPLSPGLPGRRHRHGAGAKGQGNGEGNPGKGNHGKSAEAKQRHAGHQSNGQGNSSEGSGGSSSAASPAGYSGSSGARSSAGRGGGSSSHGSSGHNSSSSHGSSSHGVSHGSSGSSGAGSSQGNAGGNSGSHGR